MIRFNIIFLSLILFTGALHCDSLTVRESDKFSSNNNVYLSFLGDGNPVSINYERIFQKREKFEILIKFFILDTIINSITVEDDKFIINKAVNEKSLAFMNKLIENMNKSNYDFNKLIELIKN